MRSYSALVTPGVVAAMLKRQKWREEETRTIAAFIVLAIVLVAWDYPYRGTDQVSPPCRVVRALIVPLAARFGATTKVVPDYAISVWDAQRVIEENRRLREEIDELTAQLDNYTDLYFELKEMREDLGWADGSRPPAVNARVIVWPAGNNPEKRIKISRIGPGLIHEGDVALQGTGLLGRVTETNGQIAEVVLLTDERQYVAARVRRTRHLGIVCGNRQQLDTPYGRLEMRDFVPNADVRAGDVVASSGDGEVYPPGLVIGEVEAVHRASSSDPSPIAIIRARADFRRLEFVRVEQR
jgi:rod shape-determining protein MreC